MSTKYTIDYVREQFALEGYILLSNNYINTKTKLKFICNNNHVGDITFERWLIGRRCRYCAGNVRYSIEYIKEQFSKENYVLLTKHYKNAHTYLEYKCPNGHIGNITWNKWQQGRRCGKCYGTHKLGIDFIKKEFLKDGYILLSTNYIDSNSKLLYLCPNGHIHHITWTNWRYNKRCPYCAGNLKKDILFIKKQFEKEGYVLISNEYTNSSTKLKYKCPNGHIHLKTWSDWNSGYRCPTCAIIKRTGSSSPNWKGGKSFESYCLVWYDKEYKDDIKQRDNNICQNPCCFHTAKRIAIHHIDYDKQNCHPSNLITLCTSCNSRANKYRDWHKEWYQILMNKKYGYVY